MHLSYDLQLQYSKEYCKSDTTQLKNVLAMFSVLPYIIHSISLHEVPGRSVSSGLLYNGRQTLGEVFCEFYVIFHH